MSTGGLFSSCCEQGLLSRCSVWASHCRGFFYCRAQALGHLDLSSCCSRTPGSGLSSYSTGDVLLCGIWDHPGPGIKPVSLHWQAGSLPLDHQLGKSRSTVFLLYLCNQTTLLIPYLFCKQSSIILTIFDGNNGDFREKKYVSISYLRGY